MSRPRFLILSLLAVSLLAFVGCEDHFERKELNKDEQRLLEQRQLLRDAITQVIAGKSSLTEAEKARVGPLWIKLRGVEDELAYVEHRFTQIGRD